MAKVSLFAFAAGVVPGQTAQGPMMQVINPTQVLVPPYLPGTFSFSIVLGIRDFDVSVEHNLKVEFVERVSKTIKFKVDDKLQPIPNNPNVTLPSEFQGFTSGLSLQNVDLRSEGIYDAVIYFDGNEIYKNEVYVARKVENAEAKS